MKPRTLQKVCGGGWWWLRVILVLSFKPSLTIALLKIPIQRLKMKYLTFVHFYTKSHTNINLVKPWPLGFLLADMPEDYQ